MSQPAEHESPRQSQDPIELLHDNTILNVAGDSSHSEAQGRQPASSIGIQRIRCVDVVRIEIVEEPKRPSLLLNEDIRANGHRQVYYAYSVEKGSVCNPTSRKQMLLSEHAEEFVKVEIEELQGLFNKGA